MQEKVLLVDDDPILLRALTDMLKIEGFDAIPMDDPSTMCDIIQHERPHVVILDLMLAATTGIELAAEMREGILTDVPRIAMSSSPFMREIAEESSLFDHVIAKPIDFDALLVLITEAMESERGSYRA